jgi:PAS domain S-box-containing protein/diguanylate cyclase (GGDEF)-like protein
MTKAATVTPGAGPEESWAGALAHEWALALHGTGCLTIDLAEVERMLRVLAVELAPAADLATEADLVAIADLVAEADPATTAAAGVATPAGVATGPANGDGMANGAGPASGDGLANGDCLAPARRVGAALVEAHMTDPAILEATLTVLHSWLPPGSNSVRVQAAIAAGYAKALRSITLAEQERLARSIARTNASSVLAAKQSEARFRAIFAGAAVGFSIADRNGQVVEVNPAMADMFGYTADEMRQLSIADFAHPTDPPDLWDRYDRLGRGEDDHLRMEKAYYRKDGSVLWTELSISVIRDEHGRPDFFVGIMDDVTERHNLQARLRHQALHDPLTGLANRTLFAQHLADLVATAGDARVAGQSAGPSQGSTPTGDEQIGICYIDIDGVTRINDRLGHDVGDQLLIAVADRVRRCAAQRGHLAARMGGDEFVILVDRAPSEQDLVELAEAVLAALAAPVSVGPNRLRVTASVGLVRTTASDARLPEILKAADVTVYRAKAQGRGRWARYDPSAVAAEVARYELAAALPDALERGEFSLVYQPIVDLPGGVLCGAEALVRWHHPQLGVLNPDRFIRLAEETGLIVPLGRLVLRQACQEAAGWRDRFPERDLFISVNVAASQTHEPSLVGDVQEILAATGLKPSRLQLELTESAVMETSGEPLRALRALSDMGVRVAIDDFGTGYSNLAYLPSLPVDALKLPQPLIEGLRNPTQPAGIDERIVDALVRLAHAIDLTVTAEGVETPTQLDRLTALGCDSAQGWYIAQPCPAEKLSEVLGALPR